MRKVLKRKNMTTVKRVERRKERRAALPPKASARGGESKSSATGGCSVNLGQNGLKSV